jgi:membrane-associated phospholipid phosphatase
MKKAAAGGFTLACLSLYVALAFEAHLHRWFGIDLSITLAVQQLRSAPLDIFLRAVSWPGYFPEFVPVFAVILYAFYRLRLRIEAIIMAAAELGVGAMGFFVKPIVGRPRPLTGLVWVNDRLPEDPYSFTAGHVHTFVVILGFIAFLAVRRLPRGSWQRTALVAGSILILLVMGFSRVYLGDHWSSDVAGGFLAGGTWLGIGVLTYQVFVARGVIDEGVKRRPTRHP